MCGSAKELVKAEIESVEMYVCSKCATYGKVIKSPITYTKIRENKIRSENKKQPQKQPEYQVVKNFSSLLQSTRNQRNMNREEFAQLLAEKESILGKWEQGIMTPSITVARRVGKILGLHLVIQEKSQDKIDFTSKKDQVATLGDVIKIRKRR